MELAIIGAGVAGLAAARQLRERRPELRITIYEKSRGLGGRVATRRREGYRFDHGAQCIKGPSPEVRQLIAERLPSASLRRISKPVWTFDGAGRIAEGDASQNAEENWIYAEGINQLGKLLGDGQEVRREVRIGALREGGGPGGAGWTLLDTNGSVAGTADIVLLTPPGPQTAEILTTSAMDNATREALITELGRSRYRRCVSLALAFDRPIERPFYALVNSDRQHPISWLGLEHTKGPERCPPGHSLLIPQMAPQWSVEQYEQPVEALVGPVAEMVGALLGETLGAPLWADLQRWRYALPDASADSDAVHTHGAPRGLFFAGDYLAEKGRIHLAIESGWRAAERIEQMLA